MVLAVLAATTFAAASATAAASDLCVGGTPGCFATIQEAVDAAGDGDTIHVGPGTFAGAITILKSVDLVGVSAGATRIEGGGPVITIGEFMGPQPTVSISRVTITGGMVDTEGVAAGGGVSIPFPGPGLPIATVSISDSVIAGNRVSPSGLFEPGEFCGPTPCAVAWGGGIDSSGNLTLTNTRVTDNVAGSTETDASAATFAEGGGIRSHPGATLTLVHSVVSGNRAATNPPNGQFAYGGGIGADGALAIEDSAVNDNDVEASSSAPSTFPFDVQQEAGAGGISSNGPATIARTTVRGNSVASSNTGGDAQAASGGIDADGTLLLDSSSVDQNSVTASVPPSSGFLAGAVFGGIEVGGSSVTIRNSRILGNTLNASSAGGVANVAGAGIGNLSGSLTLERALVTANRGAAVGVSGLVLGGGILNIDFGGGLPQLTVTDSVVTANELTASLGLTPRGGGIFSADIFTLAPVPFTLTSTVIEGNKPDQCVGC